jgi:hypothetical protein
MSGTKRVFETRRYDTSGTNHVFEETLVRHGGGGSQQACARCMRSPGKPAEFYFRLGLLEMELAMLTPSS